MVVVGVVGVVVLGVVVLVGDGVALVVFVVVVVLLVWVARVVVLSASSRYPGGGVGVVDVVLCSDVVRSFVDRGVLRVVHVSRVHLAHVLVMLLLCSFGAIIHLVVHVVLIGEMRVGTS